MNISQLANTNTFSAVKGAVVELSGIFIWRVKTHNSRDFRLTKFSFKFKKYNIWGL